MSGMEIPILIALTGASTTMAVAGAIRQGQAAQNAANYNAQVAQQNMDAMALQGQAASESQQRDSQRKIGATMAAYGASGVEMDTGTPTDVLADTVRTSALNNATLKYDYTMRGLGYQSQMELDRSNASNAMGGAYLSAAGALLQGGSKAAGYGYQFGGGGKKATDFGDMG